MLLNNSFRLVEQHLEDRASGEMQSGYKYTLRMPTLDGNNLLPYTSGGWDTVPSCIIDCSARREKEVVEAIIGEAHEKLAINLDEHPVVDRWPSTIGIRLGEGAQKSFLFIGSSHVRKLGSALRKAGLYADVIYEANWRTVKANVTDMPERLREKLEVTRVDAVVFCVLDNSIYFGMDDNGDLRPPQRDSSGKFHVHGELVVSSKSAQHVLFTSLRYLLDAAGGKNAIICSPLPRYTAGGCCDDQEHIKNRDRPGFESNLNSELKSVAENLRDFLFTSGYKLIKVLDPAVSWRGREKN